MNKTRCILVFLFLTLDMDGFCQSTTDDKGIIFSSAHSFQQVLEQAKKEGKQIFIDFYASWCGPCKRMDHEVYVDESLGNYVNEKCVSIRVQADSTKEDFPLVRSWYADARKLIVDYKIDAYPTLMILNNKCQVVARDLGYKNVSEFKGFISQGISSTNNEYADALDTYVRTKKTSINLLDLALFAKNVEEDSFAIIVGRDYFSGARSDEIMTIMMFPEKRTGG